MAAKTVNTVRVTFANRRGKIQMEVRDGMTFRELLQQTADVMGIEFTGTGFVPTADGRTVGLDDVVPADTEKVTATVAARLG